MSRRLNMNWSAAKPAGKLAGKPRSETLGHDGMAGGWACTNRGLCAT